MVVENRPGHYRDPEGNWKPDRRKQQRRRREDVPFDVAERRKQPLGRRKNDLIDLDRDHKNMIDEALEDFEAEHGD
jgi:hypothetical protein